MIAAIELLQTAGALPKVAVPLKQGRKPHKVCPLIRQFIVNNRALKMCELLRLVKTTFGVSISANYTYTILRQEVNLSPRLKRLFRCTRHLNEVQQEVLAEELEAKLRQIARIG